MAKRRVAAAAIPLRIKPAKVATNKRGAHKPAMTQSASAGTDTSRMSRQPGGRHGASKARCPALARIGGKHEACPLQPTRLGREIGKDMGKLSGRCDDDQQIDQRYQHQRNATGNESGASGYRDAEPHLKRAETGQPIGRWKRMFLRWLPGHLASPQFALAKLSAPIMPAMPPGACRTNYSAMSSLGHGVAIREQTGRVACCQRSPEAVVHSSRAEHFFNVVKSGPQVSVRTGRSRRTS